MRWSCALLSLACAVLSSEGAVLRSRAASHGLSLETTGETIGDWAASYYEAESEDRSFLISQLDETEKELVELQQFVEPQKKAPEAAAAKKEVVVAAAAKKKVVQAAAPVVKKEAAKPAAKTAAKPAAEDPAKLMASLKLPSSMLRGKAALAPMLAMLKGMYEESKERISQQNAREDKSKKWFAGKESEHKAKLAKVEDRFKNHTLSEEFRTNETRDENRYFDYWSRCRERQHRQFHTNLKIQHAMMMKTKKMIDVYEKTLSGKSSDQEAAKKQMQAGGGMPEIVLLQETQRFCRENLAEVRKERAEMQQSSQEGFAW